MGQSQDELFPSTGIPLSQKLVLRLTGCQPGTRSSLWAIQSGGLANPIFRRLVFEKRQLQTLILSLPPARLPLRPSMRPTHRHHWNKPPHAPEVRNPFALPRTSVFLVIPGFEASNNSGGKPESICLTRPAKQKLLLKPNPLTRETTPWPVPCPRASPATLKAKELPWH